MLGGWLLLIPPGVKSNTPTGFTYYTKRPYAEWGREPTEYPTEQACQDARLESRRQNLAIVDRDSNARKYSDDVRQDWHRAVEQENDLMRCVRTGEAGRHRTPIPKRSPKVLPPWATPSK